MVNNIKSKDDITTTSTKSAEVANFYDIRIVDEFAKAQPQYAQYALYDCLGTVYARFMHVPVLFLCLQG